MMEARDAVAQMMSELHYRSRPDKHMMWVRDRVYTREPEHLLPRRSHHRTSMVLDVWMPNLASQPLPGNHKLDELGYSYLNLPEQSDAAVVTIGKDVYYRDVNASRGCVTLPPPRDRRITTTTCSRPRATKTLLTNGVLKSLRLLLYLLLRWNLLLGIFADISPSGYLDRF